MTNTTETKREIFLSAWRMSRLSAKAFGGSVRSYFAECLKAQYAYIARENGYRLEEKFLSDLKITDIKKWENNGKSRVYFKIGHKAKWYMDCTNNEFFASSELSLSKEAKEYFIKNYGTETPITFLVSFDLEEIETGITDLVA